MPWLRECGNFASYSGDAGSNSARRPATLTVRFGFSQSFQANAWIFPELRHECILQETELENEIS
jgi:hypothetical protein